MKKWILPVLLLVEVAFFTAISGTTLHSTGDFANYFRSYFGDLFAQLLPRDARPEGIDATIFSGDLPEAGDGAAPAPPLPLEPAPELRRTWQRRLAELGPPPYVGVRWRAGLAADIAFRERRVRLAKEAPIEDLGAALKGWGATVLVLQRQPGAGEVARFSQALGRQANDLSTFNEKLGEMLALLGCLQAYVGVSNANVHLAASVGLRCHVLVMRQPEWRWGAKGETSPWFPGFSLYRQLPDGGWRSPMERLGAEGKAVQD